MMIKCFQYAATVKLNHERVGKDSNEIKLFYNKYNWKETNFLTALNECKKFGKNNTKVALDIFLLKWIKDK